MNKIHITEVVVGVFALSVAAFGLAAHAKAADAAPAPAVEVCVDGLSATTEVIAKDWLQVGAIPVAAVPVDDPTVTAAFQGQQIPAPADLGLKEIKGWIIDTLSGQFLAHPFDDGCISLLSIVVPDPTTATPAPSGDVQSLPFSGNTPGA